MNCLTSYKFNCGTIRLTNHFQLGDVTLKIIDTPGIADSRGVDKDISNLKNSLPFLSNYKELNAICILLKPNNAKVGVVFKYCILELLTHLNKTACNNILFLFTNSRGTFYKPGDTAKPLRKVLENIRSKPPFVDIKFDQENYFCFDSEAFKYLVKKLATICDWVSTTVQASFLMIIKQNRF